MTADLARLRELMEKATEGEWASASREGDDWDSVVYIPGTPYEVCQCFHDEANLEECDANTQLIAAMKNALPALLAELEQLRAELKHRCACRFTSGGHLKGQLCEYHRRLMNSEIEELANIARQGIGFSREVCAAAILERKK